MEIVLNSLPETAAEFAAMPQMALSVPAETCAMMLCAFELYTKDRDQGVEAMNFLRGPRPMNGYDTQFLKDRLRDKEYLPKAYFAGASPQNNYEPSKPYVLWVGDDPRPQDIPAGYIRVYLKTAGADSPRPVKLRQKGGKWYLWEYSSILTGIRIPSDPWAW